MLCARHLKKTYPEMAGVSIYGGAPGYGYSNWSNTSSYGLQMDPRDDNATLEFIHDTSLLMQLNHVLEYTSAFSRKRRGDLFRSTWHES